MARTTLGIDIRNPFLTTEKEMLITSDPIEHHRVAGGDFALDVSVPGTANAGEPAVFDIVPTGAARQVRGIVVRGEGRSFVACGSGDLDAGGCGVQIRLEARTQDSERWRSIGTYSLLHLEELPAGLRPGVQVNPGDLLGEVTARFRPPCSSGPHLHLEASSRGRATIPMVRGGDEVTESSVMFSIALVVGDDVPGPESLESTLSEAAFAASSLSDFYRAMEVPMPSMRIRARIYEALGLGAVSAYRGTAAQNAALLKALKQRGIAPSSADDVA